MSIPFFPGVLLPYAVLPLGYGFFTFINRHGAPICSTYSVDLDTQDTFRLEGLDDDHARTLGLEIEGDKFLLYTDNTAPWLGQQHWKRYALILQALCALEKHNPLPPLPDWAEAALTRALSLPADQAED